MPSLTCFNVRFTPAWTMILLAALFIGLFIRLGFWQVHRSDEKKKMLLVYKTQAQMKPMAWSSKHNAPLQYQKISLEGQYLEQVFLLDNQHHQHQFGYDVLSALLLSDGSVVVVDRGWIPGDSMRRNFPIIQTPKGELSVQGTVYYPSTNQWVLGPDSEEKEHNILILERLDTHLLSQTLQKKVYPFIIRLDKQDAHGFVREWAIVSMPPERHIAYAVQWFAMALVIFIMFIVLNLKKKNE
jgi:surfeit locus 1 family protein